MIDTEIKDLLQHRGQGKMAEMRIALPEVDRLFRESAGIYDI